MRFPFSRGRGSADDRVDLAVPLTPAEAQLLVAALREDDQLHRIQERWAQAWRRIRLAGPRP